MTLTQWHGKAIIHKILPQAIDHPSVIAIIQHNSHHHQAENNPRVSLKGKFFSKIACIYCNIRVLYPISPPWPANCGL